MVDHQLKVSAEKPFVIGAMETVHGGPMSQSVATWPQAVDRIFEGFDGVDDATPDWLELYGTGRRLRVDRFYPRIGIAIWYRGFRHSDSQDQQVYEDTLAGLCRRAGVSLVALDSEGHADEQGLRQIHTALSASARKIAHLPRGNQAQVQLLPRIAGAKARCNELHSELIRAVDEPRRRGWWWRRRERTKSSLRQLRSSWRIFMANRLAVFGLVLLTIFAGMAVAQPILLKTVWPAKIYDADTGFDLDVTHPSAPSTKHLLGTDTVGRDVLSVLLVSTAPTFVVGLTAAVTAAVVGTLIGAIAAYVGGFLDTVFMQVADGFLLLPAPLLMIVVGTMYNEMSPLVFGLLYGVVAGLSGAAIVIRSHALTIKAKPFIEAARVAGGGAVHVILRHIIPHLLPLAAVFMMITATGAVIADGFVSFLGITRLHHNWGNMIFWSFAYQSTINSTVTWNVLIPPAIAFSLFAASFYFISRGLQQVADPKLREGW
jgi:peptide/nickel transport system permease protein